MDLGYQPGNAVSNLVNKMDEPPFTATYLQLFDQIWNDADKVEDVTAAIVDHVATVYKENSPESICFLMLYNIFNEFLGDVDEDVLPNDRTGYRDIAHGRGLRSWCFDRGPHRDAGLLVASRLTRQPFIDGPDGLMARAGGQRVLETQVEGHPVYGLGLGALEGRPVATLASAANPAGRQLQVQVLDASTDAMIVTDVPVFAFANGAEVSAAAQQIQRLVDTAIFNGQVLLDRMPEAFPHLRAGPRAIESFAALSGSEPLFRQLVRHLRALNAAAEAWAPGAAFKPEGITYSRESDQTLSHGKFGPIRDFPSPPGFAHERWSLHTKLTGGAGARLYFRAVRSADSKAVLIGYFGAHLPCVLHPT